MRNATLLLEASLDFNEMRRGRDATELKDANPAGRLGEGALNRRSNAAAKVTTHGR